MPSLSGPINRIAYIDPQGQLATVSPDGQEQRLLTQSHRLFQFPAWSPDGAYLAAIGANRAGSGIFVAQDHIEPTEPEILYYSASHAPIYLSWAPDSRRISFITAQPGAGIDFHLVSVADKHSHLLATGQPFFWNWAPDSKQIFIHTGLNSPEACLAFIDLDQNKIGDNIARPGTFQAPGISAGGRFWAYAESDVLDNEQLVVENSASHEKTVIPHEGGIALSWSPCEEQLAFINPSYPVQRFYGPLNLLAPAQKKAQQLVDDTVLAFFWSPNGQYIAYLTLVDSPSEGNLPSPASGRTNGVYRGSSTGAQTETESEFALYLSLWLVEVASGQRRQLTTFEPADLFINQFLPFFDQYSLSHRLWSPTSDALVLPVTKNKTAQIVIVFTDGRSPQTIGEGSMAFWSWQ